MNFGKHNKEVIIRAVEPSDAELLLFWENDIENWQVSGTQIPYSLESIKQFIDGQQSDIYISRQVRFMIEFEGKSVGCIDIFEFDPKNLRAGIGILIEKESRNNNYAIKALAAIENIAKQTLFLKQIYAHIGKNNQASLALFEKAGFKQSGTLHNWLRNPNGWEDVIILQKILL